MVKGKLKNLTNRNKDHLASSERSIPTTASPGYPNTPKNQDSGLKSYLFFPIFISYFLHLHFKCYPESSPYPPHIPCCYPPTPTSWPWRSPVLRHIKFARPRVLSSQWWLTRPSSATYAARDTSSGGYWLVTWGYIPQISHQTQTLLHMSARFFWKDPDIAVLCEAIPVPGKYSRCLQSSIGWNTGPPMEELEKASKELKGSAIL